MELEIQSKLKNIEEMKKTIFSVVLALTAGLFVNCTSAPKVSVKDATKADSLAYVVGVAQTQDIKEYLASRMDVDTTYMKQFLNGVIKGAESDEKQNAYFAGVQIGQQVMNQIIPGVTGELFMKKEGKLN